MRYRLLGRSGLRVSELALGAMTFGEDGSWGALGSSEEESRKVFDAFLDAGGNFVDTASNYMGGSSEQLLGTFVQGRRDRIVLATKYTSSLLYGDPNAAGNHRKNMVRSVEASLRRLGTDYVDLLYVHVWDFLTPVEEVMRAFDDLVRAGKILYTGVSNAPAWVISRANTMAELKGWSPFVAAQVEYSLIERTSDREIVSMARALDVGLTAWSPLAGGLLTGKYAPSTGAEGGEKANQGGRLNNLPGLPQDRSPRAQAIVGELGEVADELRAPPSQVALAWIREQGIIPVLGARTFAQLEQNLGCLDVRLAD